MSGWCPSSSVCGRAVVRAAVVLPSAVVWLVPYSSHCSVGEYCCHVVHCPLPGVWCVVGVCLWCSCGGVSSVRSPPLVVVDGGVPSWMVGGMVSEGRLCCWCPRLVCGVPVEWRGCVVLWCPLVSCCPRPFHSVPCLRIGSPPSHCLVSLALLLLFPFPLFVFSVTALLV